MPDRGQKTEQPTPRRISKARREGQFLTARHFVSAVQFLAFVALLALWGDRWAHQTREYAQLALRRAFSRDAGPAELTRLCLDLLWRSCAPLVWGGAVLVLVTLAVQLGLSRFGISLKKALPDVKRLSPMAKLRELPRQNIPALIQAVLMLPIFGLTVYWIARDNSARLMMLPLAGVGTGARQVTASLELILWRASLLFMIFGTVDLFRQHRRYQQDLRMSRQEIRDELKEVEGNPQMKARIRRLRREVLRRRMMREIPTATAVIVNPTHYAVAIRYKMETMAAPVVVAKGKNYLALRIRQKALEHQIPLVENPPLAQALYKSVEVGQEIPAHLYRAVAEILAYIHRLMRGRFSVA